jgi:hypothetical protein
MFLSATDEVRVETAGNDVSYTLPPRPLGNIRWFGLIPVGFGLLFISFPFRMFAQALGRILTGTLPGPGNLIFLLFLVPFVVVGFIPVWIGLLVIVGRCRVDWRNGRLSVLDYVGPIRRRRRMPEAPVRKFTVAVGGAKVNEQPVMTGPLASLGALTAEYEQGKPRMLLLGYPREWLQELARDLSIRVGATAGAVEAPQVELVEKLLSPANTAVLPDAPKPDGTRVKINAKFNGVSIDVPPAGLRASKGLFTVAFVWCLILSIISAGFVFATKKTYEIMPYVLMGIFWLVGLSLMTLAINIARKRAVLNVESGGLALMQKSLFGTKHHEWRRGEIGAIRADTSGMEVNDKPIIELQIHPVTGKKVGLLAGRDEQELRWIATELRKVLQVLPTL